MARRQVGAPGGTEDTSWEEPEEEKEEEGTQEGKDGKGGGGEGRQVARRPGGQPRPRGRKEGGDWPSAFLRHGGRPMAPRVNPLEKFIGSNLRLDTPLVLVALTPRHNV